MEGKDNIQQLLQNIGLNEKEAQVYVELLRLNGSFPAILAKQCGINRSSVYIILDSLVERGIISRTQKSGQFFYFASQPGQFIQETREHQFLIQQTLDELEIMLEELASEHPFEENSNNNRVITDLEQALDETAEKISTEITDMAAIFLVDWENDKVIPYKFTKSRTAEFIFRKIKNLRRLHTKLMKPENNVGYTANSGQIMFGENVSDFICPSVSLTFADQIQKFGKIEKIMTIPIKINNKTIAVSLLAFNKKQDKSKNIPEILRIINEGGIKIYNSLLITRQRAALESAITLLKDIESGKELGKQMLGNVISELEKALKATNPD